MSAKGAGGRLERLFRLSEAGTTARTEVVAGLVTFGALSYILFVQPTLLAHPACGMDPGGVFTATALASALACFLMAFWARLPVALAPAMGHNVFFVFAVCGSLGFRWQEALAANFVAGAIFLLVARWGVRERVMAALPTDLQHAIAGGIGLLIAVVGLEWGGVVVAHPATYVTLGDLGHPATLLTLFGLALSAALLARGVRGALLLGGVGTCLAGLAASHLLPLGTPLVSWHGLAAAPPSLAGTAFHLDLGGLLARPWTDWLTVLALFLLLDLFDTVGTLVGVCRRAGLLVDGRVPRARQALAADAAGTVGGALLGTSTVTSYVESAAGVASGGRTGLTSAVVGLCFLGSLFLAPLVEMVGAGVDVGPPGAPALRYPVIAPVLILVGVMMMGAIRDLDWDDWGVAIPAFLTLVVTPLSFSVADGIAWGTLATSFLGLVGARRERVPPAVHAFAALFLLRYAFLSV